MIAEMKCRHVKSKWAFKARLPFALVLFVAIGREPVCGATGQIQVAAVTGDITVGGWTITDIDSLGPVLNDAGQLAFTSYVERDGADSAGIFRADSGSIVPIAVEQDPIPGENTTLHGFDHNYSLALNNSGQVAFTANGMPAGGGSLEAGIFRGDGNSLTRIILNAQPGAGGNDSVFLGRYAYPALDNTGRVVFYGVSKDQRHLGIFQGDGVTVSLVAGEGQAAPNGIGVLDRIGNGEPAFAPVLNNAGQVAFVGSLIVGGQSKPAVIRSDGSTLDQIVIGGQDALDGNGKFSTFACCETSKVGTGPPINNRGQVAFQAEITRGGSVTNLGIFLGDGTDLVEIVRKGDTTPDASARFSRFSGPFGLNDAGEILFVGNVDGSYSGIYRTDGTKTVEIMRQGQSPPDGNGQIGAIGFPTMNDEGGVAFIGHIFGPSGDFLGSGLFFYDDRYGFVQVVRAGDTLLGSTITNLDFRGGGRVAPYETGLNKTGPTRIGFQFSLADGRTGIAVWSLVPEPGGFTLVGVAVVGLGLLVTRPHSRFRRR